jgi:CheY-like chemotaxis protein
VYQQAAPQRVSLPQPMAPAMTPPAPSAPAASSAPSLSRMPSAPAPGAPSMANDSYLIQHVEPKPAAPAAWPDPGEPDPEPAPTQPDPYAWNPGTSGSSPALPQPKLLVWPAPEPGSAELLLAQGYEPTALKAPAQLQAGGTDRPEALLADPVGVPVTRAALHTLRAAAADSGIPLFVTAGLGAVPAAALPTSGRRGADPSVLLRALTPEQVANPRVLLIEENPDLASAFAVSLEHDGMRVIQAGTENDALSSLSAEHPQLVVMNLTLVRRRRSGVIDWLRAYERLHLAPTVLYTAPASLTADSELLRALRSGAAAVHLTDRETGQEAANRLLDLMGKVAD